MSTSSQEKPQFVQLVSAVLASTRGLVAVSAFLGSVIIAVIYLVFFQSSQEISSKPKKALQKRASPVKQRSASKQPVAKVATTSNKSSAKPAATKKSVLANGQDKKIAGGEKKELQVNNINKKGGKQESSVSKKKPTSGAPVAAKPSKTSVSKSSAAKELKDRDSEWITVTTKKKLRKISPL